MVATKKKKKESKSLLPTQGVHLSSLNSQALTLETSTLNSVLLALSKKNMDAKLLDLHFFKNSHEVHFT